MELSNKYPFQVFKTKAHYVLMMKVNGHQVWFDSYKKLGKYILDNFNVPRLRLVPKE